MDLKTAYKIIGLEESATREEVEKKYLSWIRRQKAEEEKKLEPTFNFEEINEAHEVIKKNLDYEEFGYKEQTGEDTLKEKISFIVYHYKYLLIVGVVILIIIGSLVKTAIDNQREQAYLDSLPDPEVSITFFGNYREVDTEQLEANILSALPDWERILTEVTYAPTEMENQYDIGSQQSSVISLMFSESELFFLDEHQFERLLAQEALQPIDFIQVTNTEDPRLLYGQTPEDSEDRLYAIDLSDHPIFENVEIFPESASILTIFSRTEVTPEIETFLETMIELEE